MYPSLYAIREGLHFVYQLMYLLEGTAYFSPILHLLRQRVVRVTAQELVCRCSDHAGFCAQRWTACCCLEALQECR